jgi:tRNA pseudouridine55 synthase
MFFDAQEGSVFLIDKPLGWTSFDVVNKMRYALLGYMRTHMKTPLPQGTKLKVKVGHAGTLDPLATGLLIVCAGRETKNIESYMGMDKEYTGAFCLGFTTPSFDKETEPDASFETDHITEELIHQSAYNMSGAQMQVPPIFSAIKKDGKRAYQSAREGVEVELEARPIEITEFEITSIQMPLVFFRIVCSKGTYIRSIARDFGKALHSGAYLHSLCRTRIGHFHLQDAQPLDKFILGLKESD